jgi:ADP-ribose pyrophosphatase YjhB (NUDIX family)
MERRKKLSDTDQSNKITWIPEDTYKIIKQFIPIACVDVFIENPKKGFLWIQRDIPPQLHQWAPIGGRIHKFESPEVACKRIVKKEVGLDIDVKEFLGFSEFRDENHFISLSFRATLKKPNREISINKNEVSGYVYDYDMPVGTADQYVEIFQKIRR